MWQKGRDCHVKVVAIAGCGGKLHRIALDHWSSGRNRGEIRLWDLRRNIAIGVSLKGTRTKRYDQEKDNTEFPSSFKLFINRTHGFPSD